MSAVQLRSILALGGYALLLLCAWRWEWQPGELAWGLWISGLAIVALWLLVMSALLIEEAGLEPLKTGGVLIGMSAFGCGLAWIYSVYGEILDLGFPLLPDLGREYLGGTTWRNVREFEFLPAVSAALQQYYLVVAAALLPVITGFRREHLQPDKFRQSPEFNGSSFVRLHFTILALIGLQIAFQTEASQNGYWLSAAILTVNFFPWERIAKVPMKSCGFGKRLSSPPFLPR